MKGLKGLDTVGKFSAIFTNNFGIFRFAILHTKPLLKRSLILNIFSRGQHILYKSSHYDTETATLELN